VTATQPASHPASHVAVAITLNATASSLKIEGLDLYVSVYLCSVRAEIFNRTSRLKIGQSGSKPDTWQPSVFILGILRGEYPPPQKKILYSPKTYQVFYLYLGLELSIVIKKLTINLLFNFNNFNSRLPASNQHHIKYFNPQKAHPCVIPCILSHHASKSVKAIDLCACVRKNCETKSFQLLEASLQTP